MRLTCPNCSAQYDIPEDMVPPEGREVQCSSCATVWFQPGSETPKPAEAGRTDRRPLADESTLDVLRQERAHEARLRAAERRRTRVLSRQATAEEGAETRPDAERAAAAAERARMADAASVARAREEAANAAEPAQPVAVPTVTDDVSEAIARTLREMSQDRSDRGGDRDGLSEPSPADGAAPGGDRRQARRDLLPDIEEINSSLRPDERALTIEGDTESELGDIAEHRVDRRSGFSLGFTAILTIVGIAVAIYLFAAPLGEAIPQLDVALADYVERVDAWRVALEARVDAVASSILQDQ